MKLSPQTIKTALLLSLSSLVFLGLPTRLDGQDRQTKIRGLFVIGHPGTGGNADPVLASAENDLGGNPNVTEGLTVYLQGRNDGNRAGEKRGAWALRGLSGSGWVGGAVLRFYSPQKIRDAVSQLVQGKLGGAPDDDDIFLFVFAGHGRKTDKDQTEGEEPTEAPEKDCKSRQCLTEQTPEVAGKTGCDQPECDEHIATGKGRSENLRDDNLKGIFEDIPGTKVLVFGSCFSGGLDDGVDDLKGPDTIVLMACGTNELAYGTNFSWDHQGARAAGEGTWHSLFLGALIAGLEHGNPGAKTGGCLEEDLELFGLSPAFAKADLDKDCAVTVKEWFDHARRVTGSRAQDAAKRAPEIPNNATQHPEIRGQELAARTVIFRYNEVFPVKHVLNKARAPRGFSKCGDCFEAGLPDLSQDLHHHHRGNPTTGPSWVDVRCARIRQGSPESFPWTDYHLPLPGDDLEPASRPLELEMELYEPIPEAPDAAFASWHFILDLDGARATGFPGGERPVGVFPGLGVDAWVDLIWDGVEGAFFPVLFLGPTGIANLTPAPIPVRVAFSPDRTRVAFELPLDVLEEELSALYGEPFGIDVDRIDWVAVTNYAASEADFEDPPSDFFPDRHYLPEGSCARRAGDGTGLCLNDGRFLVEVEWATPQGTSGRGRAMPLTGDTGTFWFFDPANVELIVKVIDACGEPFDRFWVFAGGLTNVEVDLTVTDTLTGEVRRYANPLGRAFEPILDTAGFDTCGTGGGTSAAAGSRTVSTSSEASTRQAVAATVGEPALFLGNGRFEVEVAWATREGARGHGRAVPLTGDTGHFWFFDPDNVELVVKVLDACSFSDRFWFFAGGLTNVEVEITVTDTETGAARTYRNPQGRAFQPILDTGAFATCG